MSRTREKITTGVYRDKFGVAIVISINGTPREFRKDSEGRKYTDRGPAWYREERKRVLARERQKSERKAVSSDTFASDVDRFLKTISAKGHRANTHGYMAHWITAFGDRQRNSITDMDALTAFAAIDKGASTKRHIRRALVNFYETLNGVSGYNPARVLIPPPKPPEEARDIPYEAIEKIFASLQPSRARARLKLLAYVGLPQKQQKQLQPSDLRLMQAEIVARPRRKGAGAAGRTLPISDKAIEALKEFIELNAFGSYQNNQLVRTFRLGATRAGVTLADDAVPYDLRHSFLSEVYRQTPDPYALMELGMHATLEQGQRYVKGVRSERATKAIKAVPRFTNVAVVQTRPKRSSSVARKRSKPTGKKSRQR